MTTIRQLFLAFCAALVIAYSTVTNASTTRASSEASTIETSAKWQRVELQSTPTAASQVTILIQTAGPRMVGLIRIPGALASNFEAGNGKTVVDLINAGDEAAGYAEIAAVEVRYDGPRLFGLCLRTSCTAPDKPASRA